MQIGESHKTAYRAGGALMLVSTALVLLTTLVLDAMAHPHGWHRHAIVYAICAMSAGVGAWQMLRRDTDSTLMLYLSLPVLIALGCSPLLLVVTLPAAMAGVLITVTQLLLVWPDLYAAGVLPGWASVAATGTIIAAYAWLVDITAQTSRLLAWCVVSAWLIALAGATAAVRRESTAVLARYRKQASQDPLTGLPNRRAFTGYLDAQIASAARHARPLALLLLDVDHFKAINDSFGHPEGDAVLAWLGAVLAERTRPADVAARIGGEEFAVVLPECALPDALGRAQGLRMAVEQESERRGRRVTVSVGVSVLSEAAPTGSDLLAAADHALYRAKDGGRNAVRAAG
jgi:diguanylate cyclase (GGDEF)-like protein